MAVLSGSFSGAAATRITREKIPDYNNASDDADDDDDGDDDVEDVCAADSDVEDDDDDDEDGDKSYSSYIENPTP